MKKFIIISIILTSLPSFASCPIDGFSNSCSIAEFQQKTFIPTYAPNGDIKEFSDTPETRLNANPDSADKKMLREFGPKNSDFGYNTNCQFGICKKSGTPQPFTPLFNR